MRADAHAHCAALALSHEEFDAIFHEDALSQSRRFGLTTALGEGERDPERQRQRAAIEAALRLTLAEKQQRDLWESSPRVRTRALLATLRKDDAARCLAHALGGVLGSDLRRVDDLRATTEEDGIDLMSVAALITTVCAQVAG